MTDDNFGELRRMTLRLKKKVDYLLVRDSVMIVVKQDTGRSLERRTGMIEINTFDNAAYLYADGEWRQIATW